MKQFILGVVVGAAALATGEWMLQPSQSTAELAQSPTADAVPARSARPGPESRLVIKESTPATPHALRAVVSPASVASQPAATAAAANFDDCPCIDGYYKRKDAREEAARKAEPKVDWSYATEQGLQQFIAGQPQSNQFQISSIECRTTFCEIKATALEQSSAQHFNEIISAAIQQSWLGLGGGSQSSVETRATGKYEMSARIYSRSTRSDQR